MIVADLMTTMIVFGREVIRFPYFDFLKNANEEFRSILVNLRLQLFECLLLHCLCEG